MLSTSQRITTERNFPIPGKLASYGTASSPAASCSIRRSVEAIFSANTFRSCKCSRRMQSSGPGSSTCCSQARPDLPNTSLSFDSSTEWLRQQCANAVLHHRSKLNQKQPLTQYPLHCPHLFRWSIRPRNQIGPQRMCQNFGVDFIGPDPRLGDHAHLAGMRQHDIIGDLIEPVVHRTPTIAGFQHSFHRSRELR